MCWNASFNKRGHYFFGNLLPIMFKKPQRPFLTLHEFAHHNEDRAQWAYTCYIDRCCHTSHYLVVLLYVLTGLIISPNFIMISQEWTVTMVFTGHDGSITGLCFAHNNPALLLSCSNDKTIRYVVMCNHLHGNHWCHTGCGTWGVVARMWPYLKVFVVMVTVAYLRVISEEGEAAFL